MRSSRGATLTSAVLLPFLAACSGSAGDEPVTMPPPTAPATSAKPSTWPSPIETADPTPTTTLVLPDQHVTSADAFVLQFFGALNAATTTEDFAAFDALYLPGCSGCEQYRGELQGWLSDDHAVTGGEWTVLQQSSEEVLAGDRILFRALAYRGPISINDASGSTVERVPGTPVFLVTGGLVASDPWLVEDMSVSVPSVS